MDQLVWNTQKVSSSRRWAVYRSIHIQIFEFYLIYAIIDLYFFFLKEAQAPETEGARALFYKNQMGEWVWKAQTLGRTKEGEGDKNRSPYKNSKIPI